MAVECERCKVEKECQFFGTPADVDKKKAQNGEWLCVECVPLRTKELDDGIAQFRRILGKD